MFKFLIITITMMMSGVANAHCKVDKKPEVECVEKKKPEVVTKWRTKIVEKKVPHIVRVPAKQKCCKKPNVTTQRAVTGNQSVIVNIPRQHTRTIIKHRVKVERRTKKINVTKPNRIQFLLGSSKTDPEVKRVNCCDIESKNERV